MEISPMEESAVYNNFLMSALLHNIPAIISRLLSVTCATFGFIPTHTRFFKLIEEKIF